MFCCKNKHKDYSLIVFSSIAFLIVLSVVFILVVFLNKVDNLKEPVKNEIKNYIPTEVSSLLVANKYSEEIDELRTNISASETDLESFELAEEIFFSVRVPDKMLDDHLQTLLQINSLKEKNENKEEILPLLNELIIKTNIYYEEDSN